MAEGDVTAWIDALPAVLAALALLLLPGLVATAPLRLGLITRVALAGVAGVVCLGVAGVGFGLLDVPFGPWQPLVPAVLLGLVAWIFRRRLRPVRGEGAGVRWWWQALSWGGSALLIALVAFWALPSPERISQTYDNVFHLSAIAHILDSGDASSLTLRTLIETDRAWSFYPAGWHSLVAATVQLTTASVPVAVNAAWLAVCAGVWLPGVAWLAQVLLRRYEPGVVALVALPLGAAFAAMPYSLLTWGTLYPTFLATALLPAAVAVPLAAWRRPGDATGTRIPIVLGVIGTFLAVAAVGFAQPRVLMTWAVLLVPFVVGEGVRMFRSASRAGGRSRTVALWSLWCLVTGTVLVAAAAFAYLVLRLGLFDRPLDDRLGGPQAMATQSVVTGLLQVLSQSWPLGVGAAVTFPAVLLAVAVLIGIVVATRTSGLRWVVVAYALVAVLFALAAGSDDVVAKLTTALWYKDRYRLSSAVPVLGVALATLGVLTAARWATRRRPLLLRPAASAGAWLVLIASVPSLAGVSSTVGFVFRTVGTGAVSEVVSEAQIAFMNDLPRFVPEGQPVLGDPWDGSALTLLYGGREPVFPHVNGQWDAARAVLALRLQDIGTDPAVCAALDTLGVRYVLYHPHEFGGGDPAGNLFAGVHAAVEAGSFTAVASDGDSTLYRIDQCGPLVG